MTARRILTVDDEEPVRCLVRKNLELAGYDVIEAADGHAGIQKIQEAHPDLVILDVRMPKPDGWEVLRLLRSDPKTEGLPVVMLTVLSDDRNVSQGWAIGADFYLAKPFEPQELVAVVTRLLEGEPCQPPIGWGRDVAGGG